MLGGTAASLTPLYPALAAARTASPTDAAQTGIATSAAKPFELDEITIADLQDGMTTGKFTARSLAEKYLVRIEEVDKQGPNSTASSN